MKELLNVRMVENDAGEIDLMVDPDDFTGAHLDLLIQALGKVRPQVQPPIPAEVPRSGTSAEVTPGPGWFVGDHFPTGTVLGFRHPAFGWLTFQIPENFLEMLQQRIASIPGKGPAH